MTRVQLTSRIEVDAIVMLRLEHELICREPEKYNYELIMDVHQNIHETKAIILTNHVICKL